MGGDAQFYAVLGDPIALGAWQGELILQAGTPDVSGAATVTGSGLIWVDILDGAQGRSCRRLESCAGAVYCDGGINADVSATLDSEGCQGVVNGSGNLPVVSVMSGVSDSGPGSMILICNVAEANFRTPGAAPDCSQVPNGDGMDSYAPARPIVFTTAMSVTQPLNACGVFAEDSVAAGEAFSCQEWSDQGSPGALAASMISEEQDDVFTFDIALFLVLDDTACGNGAPDPGEECDGGGESVDCDADCTATACGDGLVNPTAGEECETDAACSPSEVCGGGCTCIPEPVCGNGVPEAPEECDTAGPSEICDGDCTFAECGDLVLNESAGETCEADLDCTSSSDVSDEVCNPSCACVLPDVCGNGLVEASEQCDDENLVGGDGCDDECQAELPFRVALSNLNLLHNVFEDNDIVDRLRITADALAEAPPDIATFQEVAFVGDTDAHEILIDDLFARYGLVYYGVKYGESSAGQAVISRWPVVLAEQQVLPTPGAAPAFPDPRFFARVVVRAPIGALDVYALHFCADCNHDERSVQASAALDFISSTRESGHPVIIGADFNAHRGTAPDANSSNDPPIEVLMGGGLAALFDGFDAPCDPPTDRSGCTSGQDIYAVSDTTQRRIDNVMVGAAALFSSIVEIGPTETFADERRDDPNPECALDPAVFCSLSSECPVAHECIRGACVALSPACETDADCSLESICRIDLWPSDHLGVRSVIDYVPEPGGAVQIVAAVLCCLGLRRRGPSHASGIRSSWR